VSDALCMKTTSSWVGLDKVDSLVSRIRGARITAAQDDVRRCWKR